MKINFVEPNRAFPNGYLEINDARIIWKNFSGRGDRFNREGDRNFDLVIPTQEDCEMLQADKNGLKLACGNGTVLQIDELQPDGKKRMPATAFLAGHPISVG